MIVGIDPGTTTGVGILDFSGRPIKVFSKRGYGLNDLLSDLTDLGKTLIISTDKKRVPSFVHKLSVRLGARIISPDADLLVNEKKALIDGIKVKNDHERDSLACAIYSFKKISPLIERVDRAVSKLEEMDEDLRSKVKELVLQRDALPISVAIDLLTQPQKEENKIIKKIIEDDKLDASYLKLIAKLKEANNMISSLKILNNKYRISIAELQRPKKIQDSQKIIFKDQKILLLNEKLLSISKKNSSLEEEIKNLLSLVKTTREFNIARAKESVGKDETILFKNSDYMITKKKPSNILDKVMSEYKKS